MNETDLLPETLQPFQLERLIKLYPNHPNLEIWKNYLQKRYAHQIEHKDFGAEKI